MREMSRRKHSLVSVQDNYMFTNKLFKNESPYMTFPCYYSEVMRACQSQLLYMFFVSSVIWVLHGLVSLDEVFDGIWLGCDFCHQLVESFCQEASGFVILKAFCYQIW